MLKLPSMPHVHLQKKRRLEAKGAPRGEDMGRMDARPARDFARPSLDFHTPPPPKPLGPVQPLPGSRLNLVYCWEFPATPEKCSRPLCL